MRKSLIKKTLVLLKMNYLESGHSQFDISFNIDKLLNFIPGHKPTLINNGLKNLLKINIILLNNFKWGFIIGGR